MLPKGVEIKGIIETSFVDWPGRVSAVLFTGGCNFRCPFCHNHPLVLSPESLFSHPLEDVLERLESFGSWIDGVTVTGGEPTLQQGLETLMRELRGRGFAVKLDTNGSNPSVIESLLNAGLLDSVSMDLKGPLEPEAYSGCAGTTVDTDAISRSIAVLKTSGIPNEFRTTVVPGLHGEREIIEMALALQGASSWRLQHFQPEDALNLDFREIKPYSSDEMAYFRILAKQWVETIH